VVRVVTMNLWGVRGDWQRRRDVLVRGFAELKPDLVAFQEAITTDSYDQTRDLLGPQFHVVHQSEREPDGQGISIASRWPIEAVHELDLNVTDRTADFACGTLVAEITAPFGRLLFANHLPNYQLAFERERELQAVVAARFLEQYPDAHVVLAGDLDADPDATSIRFWTGRTSLDTVSVCYRNAWESVHPGVPNDTFTPDNPLVADPDWPFRAIDYLFVRCGRAGPTLSIAACQRVFDQPTAGVWASDHFGLLADLESW
jgi:endonuclease/exonuclease/phosphatase family metal-dependent hydrolase